MLAGVTSVLIVTGPIGVGKSAVVHEADSLLIDAHVPHASVVLEELAGCWPVPPEEPALGARHMYNNLASLWSNYEARGAVRLLVEMLLESRSDLQPLREAIPGAEIVVVRLRAPLALIEQRLHRRQPHPEDELSGARWWHPRMDRCLVEDVLIDNAGRPLREVAAEMLRAAGWLST
jgi:hypothetical protein